MKINEVTINKGDGLIFSVGDLDRNILPNDKDLKAWNKLLRKALQGDFNIVVPPVLELTVIRRSK